MVQAPAVSLDSVSAKNAMWAPTIKSKDARIASISRGVRPIPMLVANVGVIANRTIDAQRTLAKPRRMVDPRVRTPSLVR